MDESIFLSSIIDKLPPSWKDFKHTLKHNKDELLLVQLGSHFRIEETLRAKESGKEKCKEIAGSSSVNMIEDGKNKNNNKNNKEKKRKNDGNNDESNKKTMVETLLVRDKDLKILIHHQDDAFTWWIDSGVTFHECKDRCWFDNFHLVQDESVLHMGDESTKPILGRGNVVLEFSSGKTITLVNVVDLCDFHATHSLGNKKYVVTFIDDASRFCYVYLCHAKDEALDKFKIYKTEVELQQNDLIKILRTDRGGEYYDPVYFQSVGIIHETMAPYTPQQNGVSERKNRALKEMVNSMLSYSDLSEGFWGEAMAVVRLLEPKRKNLGEKSIDCIFIGYVEHSKAYRFYYEEDPITFDEAMQSRDVAFWKEAINDEMDSIMENNTWILSDLPPGCKWIFKKKMKVDGTIDKLLIALAATYNLVIHQMDVKTTFFNGDLEEDVYMKKPEGFIMPENEHKDMGEADVILGIRTKRKDKGITITQSHYIEKILKKFKCDDCCPFSTPLDPTIKLMPNTGRAVDQLEYSRSIDCLMYAMTSIRPDIPYVVGKLSRYTSNPSTHHWHAIMRVFKYLKKTMDYVLLETNGRGMQNSIADVRVIGDFYMKFYNSLGSVPNRCSVV
ncbi:zinc finger, CCHC-type containing protein [Tanacetum coccineum]